MLWQEGAGGSAAPHLRGCEALRSGEACRAVYHQIRLPLARITQNVGGVGGYVTGVVRVRKRVIDAAIVKPQLVEPCGAVLCWWGHHEQTLMAGVVVTRFSRFNTDVGSQSLECHRDALNRKLVTKNCLFECACSTEKVRRACIVSTTSITLYL